jgi:hypothetical protein
MANASLTLRYSRDCLKIVPILHPRSHLGVFMDSQESAKQSPSSAETRPIWQKPVLIEHGTVGALTEGGHSPGVESGFYTSAPP